MQEISGVGWARVGSPERLERVDVRAVRQIGRRHNVARTVARQKVDVVLAKLAVHNWAGRLAKRRVDLERLDVAELVERVKAAATNNANLHC